MTCLTCIARVLRTFIHDSPPPLLRVSRSNILRQQSPLRRPLTQFRRTSSAAASTQLLRDDDYIPFAPSPLETEPSLIHERLVGLQYPPPPPPAPSLGTWEPEVLLRDGDEENISPATAAEEEEPVTAGIATSPAPPKSKERKSKHTSPPSPKLSKATRRKMERYGYIPPSLSSSQAPSTIETTQNPSKKATRAARRAAKKEATSEVFTAEQSEETKPFSRAESAAESTKETKPSPQQPREAEAAEPTAYSRPRCWELPPVAPVTRTAAVSRLQHVMSYTPRSELEPWKVHKATLAKKLGQQKWDPAKRLSPEALEGLRALHAQDPVEFSTPNLAMLFKISKESVRRILKSSWRPTAEEAEDRADRWVRRAERIWDAKIKTGDIKTKKMVREEKEAFMKRFAMREKLEMYEEQGRGLGRGGKRRNAEDNLKSVADKLI